MPNPHHQLLKEAVIRASGWGESLKDSTVLVTGASGFLASSLLVFLTRLSEDYGLNISLHATARKPLSKVPLFDYLNTNYPGTWEVAAVEETILPSITGLTVVHTASYGSPRDYQSDTIGTFQANTKGIMHLYTEAARISAARVVYFSSAEIYGQPPDSAIPTSENYIGGLNTMDTRSIYGESKRMAEVLGCCLAEASGIPFTVIRPWNIYGPGQRPADGRVPIEFLQQAGVNQGISLLSDGSPRRSFCYAWDGISQIARLLGKDTGSGAWNVGNGGAEISILGLAKACAESSRLPAGSVRWDPSAKAPGMQRSAPNIDAIQSLPGYTGKFTSLSDGLAATHHWLDWYNQKYGS